MPKGILGKKMGMTQIFDDQGNLIPATVVKAGPCVVVQKKTQEKDGYQAVKLGFEDIDEKKLNKPELGQFTRNDLQPKKHLKEIRGFDQDLDEGAEITVEIFETGEKVNVTGKSKGKGFSGNIRRYNHSAGPKTHGSHFHRAPGSIGSVDAARVFKGQKMPGRMGGEKVTIENLEIVKVDPQRNVLLIKGAVPGTKKGLVTIQSI
ncbi:MAG: 50S ribosomal protein L3 [Halanaerobiaceae bacterium]